MTINTLISYAFFVYFKRPTYLHIQDTLDKKVSILMNNFYFTTGRIFHLALKAGPLSSFLFAEFPLRLGLS